MTGLPSVLLVVNGARLRFHIVGSPLLGRAVRKSALEAIMGALPPTLTTVILPRNLHEELLARS